MSKDLCLYSELEHHSGTISHHSNDLPRLIRELKLACLFYEQVIIHDGNLLEHRLTLPAFETLAPFVHAGHLWISADYSAPSPLEHFLTQTELFFGSRKRHKMDQEINEVIDRWAQIMPRYWNVQRTAQVQTLSALDRIAHYLKSKLQAQPFRQAYSLLELIQHMQADNRFNRDATLAKVGSLRGLLPPADISEMATVIQAEFIRAGAQYIGNAVIFPGGSIQRLMATQLPFDTLQLNGLKHFGIELETWLALPVMTLFDLAQSPEWQAIRSCLRQPPSAEDEETLMNYKYFFNQFNQKSTVNTVSSSKPAPVILSAPWTLASQALLGSNALTAPQRPAHAKTFILNLDSRLLLNPTLPKIQVRLEKSQTELLALLMITAEAGLAVEYIKQLELELDLLKHANGHWHCQTQHPPELDKARLNRINVLKTRTNQKIKPLGLKITVNQGYWSLIAIEACQVTFELAGSVWEHFQSKKPAARPSGLSKQLAQLWDYLWNCSPHFVHAEALATVLGNGYSLKQVSDAIYKLEKHLHQEKWLIVHNYLGEYALIPKGNFPLLDRIVSVERVI